MSDRPSLHFSWPEFACRDGSPVPDDLRPRIVELAAQLEVIRAEFGGRAMTIRSGYRSPAYNRKVGGARKSQHVEARAADIVIAGVSTEALHSAVLRLIREGKIRQGGVGYYPRSGFVHYDIRGVPARWRQRG